MTEPLIACTIALMAFAAFWLLVPKCPECGCVLTTRDQLDPSLRHCRRCLSIFRSGDRR